MSLTVGSLFSGIGGFDLGLERAGMTVRWQVENDPYCNRVLAQHWPDVPRYGDIRELDPATLEPVDIVCGGFPCQPASIAGKRRGRADSRWLWDEFYRITSVVRPRFVLVENVPGLLTVDGGRAFGGILGDLAASGFDAIWDCLPAAAVGAPHLRWRLFLVAYARRSCVPTRRAAADVAGTRREAESEGIQRQWGGDATDDCSATMADTASCGCLDGRDPQRQDGDHLSKERTTSEDSAQRNLRFSRAGARRALADADSGRLEQRNAEIWRVPVFDALRDRSAWWDAEPNVGRVAYGVPARVDRLRGLGNAVVPQVAEVIGRWLMSFEP